MTEILNRRQAGLLALAVIVGLVLLGYGLFAIGDQQQLWHGRYEINVQLPNAGGLDIGTRVRIQGVQAGQVTAIDQPAQRGGTLHVKLRLDGKARKLLGEDAYAVVINEGLLGGKVIDINPGSPGAELLAEHATIPGQMDNLNDDLKRLTNDLRTLSARGEKAIKEVESLAHDLREGRGLLGQEVLSTLKQVRDSSQSLQNGFDAMKHLPLVGKHVDPYTKLLVRPGMDKLVAVFTEDDLFHEGRSVFHPEGVEKLRSWAVQNIPQTKLAGSEVVIVAYADPQFPDSKSAEILTQEQAEAVKTYLSDHHGIHKLGTFSRRTVQAIGMGTKGAPGSPHSPPLPLRRIEVIFFAPAGTLS